ncbi:MAG TPA: hypothetical protein VM582_08545 [Candidatus Thermoplasmatota archaeon]|nr:hypothetical protein [Candidatus Thermoplasmatota archaeon]
MRLHAPALALALVLVASAWLVAPAAAFHDPAPLVDERVIEGPFWMAWRVDVTQPGTTFSFEIDAPESEDRKQVGYGLWVLRVDGSANPFFFIGTGGTRPTEVHVDQEEPVPHEVHVGPVAGSSGPTSGFAYTRTDAPLGEYWLVIVNTSPWATKATVRLYATSGVALVASAQGSEGGLLRETDFATTEPYRHVRTGFFTVTAQAHSLRNASATVEVENALFGLFALRGGEERDMSRIRPNGQEVRPNVVPSMTLNAEAAGTHVFKVNAWDVAPRAAAGPDAYIVLLWADVALP